VHKHLETLNKDTLTESILTPICFLPNLQRGPIS
jgi:hypothetical protein